MDPDSYTVHSTLYQIIIIVILIKPFIVLIGLDVLSFVT